MFSRYAVYFVPDGPWGDFGADWLGWDNRSGSERKSPQPVLTERPRKYGFHATVKPPFRLATGVSPEQLSTALETLCAELDAIALSSLQLSRIGHFFALTAPDEAECLRGLASRVVAELDGFRAPLTAEDLARRRASRLTERQDALLEQWGYPYVMEEFRFHLTLTGPVKGRDAAPPGLDAALAPLAGTPLRLGSLSLLGEQGDGRFVEVARFNLREA